ncbi:MAG: metallophosphoesterase [Acidobacteria bacterium]|nr:metallophosphoesterase [Acidobacteriota bacterium]
MSRGLRLIGAVSVAVVLATLSARWIDPAILAASSCNLTNVERVVAIGDVHGAYDRFVEILTTTGLVDARQRWTGGRAHLVQLGDVLDRGPDSRKAQDLLRRLQDEAARAGGAVHPLVGNHETMRMLGDLRYTAPGEYQAFITPDSERIKQELMRANPNARNDLMKTPLGFTELRQAYGRDGAYGKWLRTLDAVVKIDGVLFLHGGISPSVAAWSCDAINDAVRKDLAGDLDKTRANPLASLVAREDGPLWYRGLALEPDTFAPDVDKILAAQHAKALVVGHTVTPDGRILSRFGGKVVQIDTGMQPAYVPTGRASALEIQRGGLTAIYTDRRDVLVAPPAETPKDQPVAGR